MAQTDNEKELILGNKQLISLFFLVVAMCGAFFAFGYLIGRNASRAAPTSAATTTADESAQSAPAPAPEAPTESAETAPAGNDAQPSVAEAQPAEPQPAATHPAETHPAKDAPQAAALPPAPPAPPAPAIATGPDAIYLQVTALHRADADNLVKTLKEQNLPALTAGSSKPDLYRVMVGPYHQMTQVADAKAKLKALGFANAFVQK